MVLTLLGQPVFAQEPGWHFSPLPGEGDRASLGCARESTATDFTCLAVRCEDDFSTGIHLYASRPGGAIGTWVLTLDREDHRIEAVNDPGPYSASVPDPDGWLLERLRHGTFIYLRHADDPEGGFAYVDLGGSYQAIAEALYWCAPKRPATEQKTDPGVSSPKLLEQSHESSPVGTE
jgi:hypothetical protein